MKIDAGIEEIKSWVSEEDVSAVLTAFELIERNDHMNDEEINPCPFCGATDISLNAFSISEDAYILCKSCKAGIEIQVPWNGMNEEEHDAVCTRVLLEKWNQRV